MLFREHAADLLDMSLRKVVMICVVVSLLAVAYFFLPYIKQYKFKMPLSYCLLFIYNFINCSLWSGRWAAARFN